MALARGGAWSCACAWQTLVSKDRDLSICHLGLGLASVSRTGASARRSVCGRFGLLSREELAQARSMNFTRRYESHWENVDHSVEPNQAAEALPQLIREMLPREALHEGYKRQSRRGGVTTHRSLRKPGRLKAGRVSFSVLVQGLRSVPALVATTPVGGARHGSALDQARVSAR